MSDNTYLSICLASRLSEAGRTRERGRQAGKEGLRLFGFGTRLFKRKSRGVLLSLSFLSFFPRSFLANLSFMFALVSPPRLDLLIHRLRLNALRRTDGMGNRVE